MIRPWRMRAVVASVVATCVVAAVGQQQQPLVNGGDTAHLAHGGVCGSIEVLGPDDRLDALANCTIIIGYLRIGYMPSAGTFPLLREVTDYVVFYRAGNVKSLGALFPNLSVIGGRTLMNNYALTVYGMPNLTDLDLSLLTTIQSGYVYIAHNPILCYVTTIDWNKITNTTKGNVLFDNAIDACPTTGSCRGCDPERCWRSERCQQMPMSTCHTECLGGCTIWRNVTTCLRCKNYADGGVCVANCPPEKYAHAAARMCVTESACHDMNGWIWQRQCIYVCPNNYKMVNNNGTKDCLLCGGNCKKTCEAIEIKTLNDLKTMHGCNIIQGALHIKFTDQNTDEKVMNELTEYLKDVEEIEDYLMISRSISITSLNFFKNLTSIGGNKLLHSRYAFIVTEMENLETLWDWNEHPGFNIRNGTILFHYNPNLCPREIEKLKNASGVVTGEDDVSHMSNGFGGLCHYYTINATSEVIGPHSVAISWNRTNHTTLAYLIYYIEETGDSRISHYGKDTCYSRGWQVMYVDGGSATTPNVTLTGLKGYTDYAFYVETYKSTTYKTPTDNGRSALGRFRTKMEGPTLPVEIDAISETPNSITVTWKDDPTYRGVATHYFIELEMQAENVTRLDTRNYCVNPPTRQSTHERRWLPLDGEQYEEDGGERIGRHCSCFHDEWLKQVDDPAMLKIINVTPASPKGIDPFVFCQQETDPISLATCIEMSKKLSDILGGYDAPHQRLERNARRLSEFHKSNPTPTPHTPLVNITVDNAHHTFSTKYTGSRRNYTIEDLVPYGRYLIYIFACLDEVCGPHAVISYRVMDDPSRDQLTELRVKFVDQLTVEVGWDEPKTPNGAILYYTLEYGKSDEVNASTVCVTRKQHEQDRNIYRLELDPGLYKVRVRAHSLATDGVYTPFYQVEVTQKTFTAWWTVLGLGSVLAGGVLAVVFWLRKRHAVYHDDTRRLVNDEYHEMPILFTVKTAYEDDDRIELYDDVVLD